EGSGPMANPLELRAARAHVLAQTKPDGSSEQVPLAAAHGRTLAVAVCTDTAWPVTDRSAMDGFAIAVGGDAQASGLLAGATMAVGAEGLAGQPFDGVLPAGKAVRIMTGAVVPEGADLVVPVEDTSGYEGATVTVQVAVAAGANIRRRGSERDAGV